MSLGHLIDSSEDRYYTLLISNWVLVKVSLQLLRTKQSSTLFMLFSEQWFIALWNDTIEEDREEGISSRYKEEICLSLLEASMVVKHELESALT